MKIDIKELKIKTTKNPDKKYPDLLARVSLIFIDDHERSFTCTGFTLRKSQYDNKSFLAMPSKATGKGSYFKFNLIEKSLLKEIEKEAVNQYEKDEIPIIDEENSPPL